MGELEGATEVDKGHRKGKPGSIFMIGANKIRKMKSFDSVTLSREEGGRICIHVTTVKVEFYYICSMGQQLLAVLLPRGPKHHPELLPGWWNDCQVYSEWEN